jgi:hypothetical protein
MRRWMLFGMLTVCSVAMGQVTGRLEGWFVTDEGVPFFMAVNAPTERIALRPVWGHYALTLSIQAPAPMREVTVFNRGGQTIWRQVILPPQRTVTIPPNPFVPLRVHASDGFAFRIVATLADGRQWTDTLTMPLRPLHPLRIDWLQLLACLEAQRLLHRYGNLLRPNLSRQPVAFRLIGENGELLWERPKPLPDYRPISLALLPTGKTWWRQRRVLLPADRFGGYTAEMDGTMVSTLWSSPWWACRHPTAVVSRFVNATLSVYFALHEGLHALTLHDLREEKTPPVTVPLERLPDWLVCQWLESKALDEAVNALENSDEAAATEWAWAFLQFRDERRALWGRRRDALTRWEQTVEWAENIAHWGALTILKQSDASKNKAIPYLHADPTVAEYADDDALEWSKGRVEGNEDLHLNIVRFYRLGTALNELMGGDDDAGVPLWLRRAFQGERLEKLLAEVTGYSVASPQKRKEVVAKRAGEPKAQAKSLQKQLRTLLSPQPSAPTLTIHCDEAPEVRLQTDDEGRLTGLTLKWDHAGLTVSVKAAGHLWWRDQKTVVVALPSERPDLIARHRDELTAWFGEIVRLNWDRTDTEAIVKVGNQRWRWGNVIRLPDFCPPDGWFALRDGNRWLWLKAAVRGGLQLFGTGGVRFTEVPMMPVALTLQKSEGFGIALSPSRIAALTTFAPAEALFVARTPDGVQRLRRLQVVTHQIDGQRAIPLARIAATATDELRLTVPLQPRWSLKREGDKEQLAWSVTWAEGEMAWSPFGALHEVTVTTDLGTKSLAFLTGVLAPMVQAIKARVHERLSEEGAQRSRPLSGARVSIYYCPNGAPEPNRGWKVAEGVTDESGTTFLLRPFSFGGFGAFWMGIAERPDWGCRMASWKYPAIATYELFGDFSVASAFFLLAPHQVVIPIECVRRYPNGREAPADVEVIVSRSFGGREERILARTLVFGGKTAFTIPTLPHDLWGRPTEAGHTLRLEVRDWQTGVRETIQFGIDAHTVFFWQSQQARYRFLVGSENAPLRIILPVREQVTKP